MTKDQNKQGKGNQSQQDNQNQEGGSRRTPVHKRTKKERRECFKDDVEKRMEGLLEDFNKITKMAKSDAYSFTEKDVKQINAAIDKKHEELKEAFDSALNKSSGESKAQEEFNLDKGIV